MSRPELTGHASAFYNAKEARKYDSSSRMMSVQREITERAIELLRLDSSKTTSFVLDIGCGSGLSGQVLEEHGHVWVGCDISRDMLQVAQERIMDRLEPNNNETQMKDVHADDDDNNDNNDSDEDDDGPDGPSNGDLLHHDMGTGLPFRDGTFDACISISAIQWLCYSNSKAQVPKHRLMRFFSSLYQVLKKGGRAVLQFYPETAEQAVLISECATQVGFVGGVVVDYPNSTKAKKHYLVLQCHRSNHHHSATSKSLPAALTLHQDQQEHVSVGAIQKDKKKTVKPIRKKKGVKTKEWILQKKQTQRKQGKNVRPDTKYTARRRPTKF